LFVKGKRRALSAEFRFVGRRSDFRWRDFIAAGTRIVALLVVDAAAATFGCRRHKRRLSISLRQFASALRIASTELSPHWSRFTKTKSSETLVRSKFGLSNPKTRKDSRT